MDSNPYASMMIGTDESIYAANALNSNTPTTLEIFKISEEIGKAFIVCHLAMGLKDATILLNEVLADVSEQFSTRSIFLSEDRFDEKTIEALHAVTDASKENVVCKELFNELGYVRKLGNLVSNLKPVYCKFLERI